MPVNWWQTLFASVIPSGLLAWFVAGWRARREVRATRAEDALGDVRDAVGETLGQVREYRAGVRVGAWRRPEEGHELEDIELACAVMQAAAALPRWRQRLVCRRLRRLVGPDVMTMLDISPDADTVRIASNLVLHQARTAQPSARGLLDRGLREISDSKSVRRAEKHLRKLSRAC
jgi:hypothetical protein